MTRAFFRDRVSITPLAVSTNQLARQDFELLTQRGTYTARICVHLIPQPGGTVRDLITADVWAPNSGKHIGTSGPCRRASEALESARGIVEADLLKLEPGSEEEAV